MRILKLFLLFNILITASSFAQNPKDDSVWNAGVKYIQSRDYLRGLEMMNSYLRSNPNNLSALYNLSICHRFLGDMKASCADMAIIQRLSLFSGTKYANIFCNEELKAKWLKKQYYKHTKLYPELGYRPKYTRADTLRGALRPERDCYDVYYYNLTVRILPFKKSIEGTNEIWFRGIEKSKKIQVDLFDNFDIQHIKLDDKELSYHREYQAVFIDLPENIIPGQNYKLTIDYSGKPLKAPNPPWDGGFVWKRDKAFNRWVGVACEQLGASSWWPNKDHLSDKPDSMAINIEVPEKYEAVCNGRLRDIVQVDNRFRKFEWFVDYPINNYNVTFYMGKYAEFTDTLEGPESNLVMRYHVLPYHLELAKHHFQQAKDVVAFYNKAFGPFPFWRDNYRMVESPYEGMEHQTAIAYGNTFSNLENSRVYLSHEFDYIIVHETAHEWWGNAVAAGDMADIWIHEGFATYAEILFLEDKLGYEASIEEMQNHMQFTYNLWPLVQNRDVNENAFASNDVYTKGATLLHCLRATMDNDSLFKKLIYDFNMEYRFKIVTSNDFIQYTNNYTGTDYTSLFDKFLYDKDIPVLEYSIERDSSGLIFKYKWTEVGDGFTMPFSIETFGNPEYIRLVATTEEQEIVLKNTTSISFFNFVKSTNNCPHNGLTYYWTHLVE